VLTLAITTSTSQVGVALGTDGRAAAELHIDTGRRHGEVLAPAIESILALSSATAKDIQRVAVDIGPGLFTGLRVGVATGKALAAALSVPIVIATSLEILAARHKEKITAVVDARRGEVFWATFEDGVQLTEAVCTKPEAVPEGAMSIEELPSAGALLRLTADRDDTPVNEVTPLYLRGADVRIGWEQRG
jgi:tRNA threonylcarbamoyl adenosine modification protein YeaZ